MTDHQAMQQALSVMQLMSSSVDDDCGDPVCDDCKAWRPLRSAMQALRERLALCNQQDQT